MSFLPFHLTIQLCRWWMWSCCILCMVGRLNSSLWWVLMWSSFINWVQHKARVIVVYMWWWEPQALDLHTFIYYNTQKQLQSYPMHTTPCQNNNIPKGDKIEPLHCIWKSRYSIIGVGVGIVAFFWVPLNLCALFPPPPHYH